MLIYLLLVYMAETLRRLYEGVYSAGTTLASA